MKAPFHFGEHDTSASGSPPTVSPAAFVRNTDPGPNESGCFRSVMFSCHDGALHYVDLKVSLSSKFNNIISCSPATTVRC